MNSTQPSGFTAAESAYVQSKAIYAQDRLKQKFPASVSYEDLVSYCFPSTERKTQAATITFWQFWTKQLEKVAYDAKTNTYRFKPLHDISSKQDLLKYLQTQPSALGLEVKELKDVWPNIEDAITELERVHKVLVHRNKKDGHARRVWRDNSSLYTTLDQEYRDEWFKIPLPTPEDIVKELARIGHKSASQANDPRKNIAAKEKKPKKVRSGTKVTNTHMIGMFRDYSGQRAKGGR